MSMSCREYNDFLRARLDEAKSACELSILQLVQSNSDQKELLARLGGSYFILSDLSEKLEPLLGDFYKSITGDSSSLISHDLGA